MEEQKTNPEESPLRFKLNMRVIADALERKSRQILYYRGGTLGSYLGTRLDPTDQTCREVYGMQLDLTLSLDIYAPARMGAAGCDGALETLHQVVLQGLPSGLKPRELKWEEAVWDPDTAMFLRRGSLTCDAYFTATISEDGLLLSDFILKGVVTN